MTTKSAPLHVLRTVRTLYGLSQQKLARMVGCSLTTIKQIETGRLSPSAQLAHRIYMRTGLDPGQLMENSFPETPFHAMGSELSKETFELIERAHHEGQTQERVDEMLRHLAAVQELFLDVSTRRSQLWALYPALQNAIDKLIDDFELRDDLRRELARRFGLKDPWSNVSPAESLYTIANGELFEKQREQALEARKRFYELQALKAAKNGKHEPGRNHRSAA